MFGTEAVSEDSARAHCLRYYVFFVCVCNFCDAMTSSIPFRVDVDVVRSQSHVLGLS